MKDRGTREKEFVQDVVALFGRTAGLARRAARETADRLFGEAETEPAAAKPPEYGGLRNFAHWVSVRLLPGDHREGSVRARTKPSGKPDTILVSSPDNPTDSSEREEN
ncbi:MAG: hypothetical protein ACYTFG_22400 [Planctomycetota bacterium]